MISLWHRLISFSIFGAKEFQTRRNFRRTGAGDWSIWTRVRALPTKAMLVPWTLSTALVSSIASVAVGFSASASLGVVAKHGEPRACVAKYVQMLRHDGAASCKTSNDAEPTAMLSSARLPQL